MTERIFGPFGDTFDDALSRLESAIAKSETDSEIVRINLEQLLHGAHAPPGHG